MRGQVRVAACFASDQAANGSSSASSAVAATTVQAPMFHATRLRGNATRSANAPIEITSGETSRVVGTWMEWAVVMACAPMSLALPAMVTPVAAAVRHDFRDSASRARSVALDPFDARRTVAALCEQLLHHRQPLLDRLVELPWWIDDREAAAVEAQAGVVRMQ